jgi:hypothetical protein
MPDWAALKNFSSNRKVLKKIVPARVSAGEKPVAKARHGESQMKGITRQLVLSLELVVLFERDYEATKQVTPCFWVYSKR